MKQTQTRNTTIVTKDGRVVDRKRSLAAKKAAQTRARNLAANLERKSLRLHHKLIAAGLVLAVALGAGLLVRNEIEAYAATTAQGTFVGLADKCIDNDHSVLANGTNIQLWKCNDTNAQKWNLQSDGSIRSVSGAFCLDVPNASKNEYTYIRLYACNGSPAQQFSVANGVIKNKVTGYCITVRYSDSANGTRLWMVKCNNSKAQKWSYGGTVTTAAPVTTSPAPTTTPSSGATTNPVTGGVTSGSSSGGSTSPVAAASADGFVHPGIMVGKPQLDYVKAQLKAGREPWKTQFERAKNADPDQGKNKGQNYASLSWTPHPRDSVGCGPYNKPDYGCFDATNDATAAYIDALVWYYTGDERYAQKSIEIMNAWSGKLDNFKFDKGTYSNGKLVAAWVGETFPRAGEIIRYTYTPSAGKTKFQADRFGTMLKKAILPQVKDGWTGGAANWLLSMAEATMNIGIYTGDRAVFNNGVADWRAQVPAAIYMAGDQNRWSALKGLPISPPGTIYDKSSTSRSSLDKYWFKPDKYVSGLWQETCRDSNHMAMGIAAMINGAETARLQGVDLYGEQQKRITTMLELNTRYLNDAVEGKTSGDWQCKGRISTANTVWRITFEIAYNHYANRKGVSLPQTKEIIQEKVRKGSYMAQYFADFESLTAPGTP